jgi:hypothetical protein
MFAALEVRVERRLTPQTPVTASKPCNREVPPGRSGILSGIPVGTLLTVMRLFHQPLITFRGRLDTTEINAGGLPRLAEVIRWSGSATSRLCARGSYRINRQEVCAEVDRP